MRYRVTNGISHNEFPRECEKKRLKKEYFGDLQVVVLHKPLDLRLCISVNNVSLVVLELPRNDNEDITFANPDSFLDLTLDSAHTGNSVIASHTDVIGAEHQISGRKLLSVLFVRKSDADYDILLFFLLWFTFFCFYQKSQLQSVLVCFNEIYIILINGIIYRLGYPALFRMHVRISAGDLRAQVRAQAGCGGIVSVGYFRPRMPVAAEIISFSAYRQDIGYPSM